MKRFDYSTQVARKPRTLRTICVAATALIAMFLPWSARADTSAPTPAALTAPMNPARVDYLPPLNLIDQNGKPISLSSFKGKPVLVGFIHTDCKGICELMTAKMKQVAQTLGARFNSSVAIVSITTDPDEDRPAQLLAYAKAQGVDADGFTFLTGNTRQIDGLLTLFDVPEEGPNEATTHVLDLFLVAPDGFSMRKYDGMSVSPQSLASAIRSSDPQH